MFGKNCISRRPSMGCFVLLAVVIFCTTTKTDAFVCPSPNLANQQSARRSISFQPQSLTHLYSTPTSEEEKLRLDNEKDVSEESFEPLDLSPSNTHEDFALSPMSPLDGMEDDVFEKDGQINIWVARGILLFVAALWGTNFASVKYLETLCFHPPCNHPASEFAFARFTVAGLISLPLLFRQRLDVIMAGLECGLWITMGYITQAMALETIPSGKCAFICSLTVVVVPVLSYFLEGKKITSANLLSGAIALTGVGILEGLVDFNSFLGIQPAVADASSIAASTIAESTNALASASVASTGGFMGFINSLGLGKGDLLALGQPVGFGLSFLRIEHYVEKFKDVENRVLTIAASQCVAVGIVGLLWVLYDYNWTLPNFEYMLEPHRIGAIAWTGIMTTVVAIFLEGIALQTASATEAALTFSSEPVWASVFAAWLLKEQLNLNSYVGGAFILSACVLGALADLRKEQGPESEEATD